MSQLTLVIANKNYSSWSLRPWLALKQAGLDFAEIRISLDTPTTHQEIRRYSPSGVLPVLQHGNLTVWESLAICEYIAESFASNLWPDNTAAKALARSISAEIHAGFQSLREHMPMNCRARLCLLGTNHRLQADINRILTIWHECRGNFSSEGDLLFGRFTIADAMFAPVVSRFITYDVKLDSVAKAYVEAIWALPAMQEWVEEANNEVENVAQFKVW